MVPRSSAKVSAGRSAKAIRVAVIVQSTLCPTGAALDAALGAWQTQVERDFAPVWGVDAQLQFIVPGAVPLPTDWWLVLLDDETQAADLGYADLTPAGFPMGKVFLRDAHRNGQVWTVQVSHQLLEMLADPDLTRTVIDSAGARLLAMEVCDPVRSARHGYAIDGVRVSNFVYPAWFQTFQPEGTRFDHLHLVERPLQLLPDGCVEYLRGDSERLEWQEESAGRTAVRLHPAHGTRRERRGRAPSERRRSEARFGA